ncbi:MAG TPA: hypothetical protein VKV74_09680 [Bryobacteraceae bacterium]|nr:hypothetical protein [Bryobacteraceae bacterium]
MRSHIRFEWAPSPSRERFRTGVSLHSHTLHSQESFEFIRRAGLRTPLIAMLIRAAENRYHRRHGKHVEFARAWWTPPLSPCEVKAQETFQIEQFGLNSLVAITDHDDIQASMELRSGGQTVPIALEWSVPFGPALFHLGVYNLPPARAEVLFQAMQDYRRLPTLGELSDLLAELTRHPATLLVLNHPFWDETGIGNERHEEAVRIFARMYRPFIHAIELNGLRPPGENERARHFAASLDAALISGGDRHGLEPNAVLNLTNAGDFSEFVQEIRDGCSRLLFLNRYRRPHCLRMARNTIDMFRTYHAHARGWRVWTERAFYRDESDCIKSFAAILTPNASAHRGGPASVRGDGHRTLVARRSL